MNIRTLAVAALALGFCGCAATSLQPTWKSPTYKDGPVQKVAVLAVDDRETYRAAVESHYNVQLNDHGQAAFVIYDLLSLPAIKEDKQAAAAQLRERGADSLLLVRLAGATSSSSEVRATSGYAATVSGYAGGDWYGYYTVAFMDMGTIWGNSKREVYLETSLFDLKSGQKIWSGTTRTVLKEEADRIEALSKLVTQVLTVLRKDGLVH